MALSRRTKRTFEIALGQTSSSDEMIAALDAATAQDAEETRVATVAALALLDTTLEDDGTSRFVTTKLQAYRLDKASTETVNGITVVATLSGTGRWVRLSTPVPHWTAQTTWYQDAVAGDDENSGATSLLPVKTFREICCRLRRQSATTYTFNCLNATTASLSTDYVRFDGDYDTAVIAANHTNVIVGVRTTLATGTFTASSATVVGTNTQASVTAVAGPWTAQLGRHIVVTSGAATGGVAVILKDLGADAARVSEFINETTGVLTAFPAPGDTFAIVGESSWLAPLNGNTKWIELKNVELSTGILNVYDGVLGMRGTRHTAALSSVAIIGNSVITMINPAIYFAAVTRFLNASDAGVNITGGGSINARLEFQGGQGRISIGDFVGNGGSMRNVPATSQPFLGGQFINRVGTKLGWFDAPASEPAIAIDRGNTFVVSGTLYGTTANATYGVSVKNGGRMMILAAITPTITGASGDLILDGVATALSGLEADAQFGTSTLTLGESAAIAANITATSRIVVTPKDKGVSVTIGRLEVPSADRSVGAPGSFKVKSFKADATAETADVSTFDWEVRPSLSALTTWAQWAAAPFSRNAVSYKTLAAITNL